MKRLNAEVDHLFHLRGRIGKNAEEVRRELRDLMYRIGQQKDDSKLRPNVSEAWLVQLGDLTDCYYEALIDALQAASRYVAESISVAVLEIKFDRSYQIRMVSTNDRDLIAIVKPVYVQKKPQQQPQQQPQQPQQQHQQHQSVAQLLQPKPKKKRTRRPPAKPVETVWNPKEFPRLVKINSIDVDASEIHLSAKRAGKGPHLHMPFVVGWDTILQLCSAPTSEEKKILRDFIYELNLTVIPEAAKNWYNSVLELVRTFQPSSPRAKDPEQQMLEQKQHLLEADHSEQRQNQITGQQPLIEQPLLEQPEHQIRHLYPSDSHLFSASIPSPSPSHTHVADQQCSSVGQQMFLSHPSESHSIGASADQMRFLEPSQKRAKVVDLLDNVSHKEKDNMLWEPWLN